MVTDIDPNSAASAAAAAAGDAKRLRENLRWHSTPGDPQREEQIAAALDALDEAMKPVRSWMGKLAWEPQPDAVEIALIRASRACQYERRQLKKMRRR